ncbi:MAG: transcriptional repressor LexA [Spirochaetales bacterium]|nr:transcriptional repressor LexA [Spirochaetales bacterium]
MKQMTSRQKEIYQFLEDFIEREGYSPSIREVGAHFGISAMGARDHLQALEKKGFIQSGSNTSRSIVLNRGKEEEILEIPILGHVAAGQPLLAEENLNGSVKLPASFFHQPNLFALYVEGDSMIGAGIFEGDLAILHQQEQAENGQIVVAMVEEAVTLKRFYREKSRVRLQAENPEYSPIYASDIRILGRLVHLIRNYE